MKFNLDLESICQFIDLAYYKLKSTVYYDKTQKHLRDKLVDYSRNKFEDFKNNFCYNFDHFEELLSDIKVLVLPKKINNKKTNSEETIKYYNNSKKFDDIDIDEQVFFDAPVDAHLLGVIWIMLVGYKLDYSLISNSFGNRIKKDSFSEKEITANTPVNEINYINSHYIFYPYYEKFENWQEYGYKEAENILNNNKDCIVMTTDIERFYYHIDLNEKIKKEIYGIIDKTESDSNIIKLLKKLTDYCFKVSKKFTEVFNDYENKTGSKICSGEKNTILPIGFFPSGIISNFILDKFDRKIITEFSPDYYGRYVDDLIIIKRVESDSNDKIDVNTFIDKLGVFDVKTYKKNDTEIKEYFIAQKHVYDAILKIKNSKTIISYFDCLKRHDSINEIIDYFKNKERMFNYLNEEEIEIDDKPLDIYTYENEITKFNQICEPKVDKYKLSLFIAKYKLYFAKFGMKDQEKNLEGLLKCLTPEVLIENYGNIEKLFYIFVLSIKWYDFKYFNMFIKCIDSMFNALKRIKNPYIFKGMRDIITYSIYSVSANFNLNANEKMVSALEFKNFIPIINFKNLKTKRENYIKAFIFDKSVIPLYFPIVKGFINSFINDKSEFNGLYDFNYCIELLKNNYDYNDETIPIFIKGFEMSLVFLIDYLVKKNYTDYLKDKPKIPNINKFQNKIYNSRNLEYIDDFLCPKFFNFPNSSTKFVEFNSVCSNDNEEMNNIAYYRISSKENIRSVKVAISNIQKYFNLSDFTRDKINRSEERFFNISKLVNEAILNKVDFLVMPEACIPIEWIIYFANMCAKNNIALITGIEPMVFNKNVYNYTFSCLPYDNGYYKEIILADHLKKYYAPIEIKEYRDKNYNCIIGLTNELINYKGFYYKMMCCYELAILEERKIFYNYIDAVFVVECNRDINYFDNIVSSYSRDLHCYVIQVNNSLYGDSRITQPTKTETMNMVKVKGGVNPTILYDTIDIKKLREFQSLEVLQQMEDKAFKVTPTNYDKNGVIIRNENECPF